jgi:hypothetical protein
MNGVASFARQSGSCMLVARACLLTDALNLARASARSLNPAFPSTLPSKQQRIQACCAQKMEKTFLYKRKAFGPIVSTTRLEIR